MDEGDKAIVKGIAIACGVVLLCIGGGMYGCPQYNVYTAEMGGRAELARAEQNRQIQIYQAKGQLEAAKLLASAEVERAKGVAQSNEIIAGGLGGPEGYLRYLYIQGLDQAKNQIIYVPTEANIPILEAGRFARKEPPPKE